MLNRDSIIDQTITKMESLRGAKYNDQEKIFIEKDFSVVFNIINLEIKRFGLEPLDSNLKYIFDILAEYTIVGFYEEEMMNKINGYTPPQSFFDYKNKVEQSVYQRLQQLNVEKLKPVTQNQTEQVHISGSTILDSALRKVSMFQSKIDAETKDIANSNVKYAASRK